MEKENTSHFRDYNIQRPPLKQPEYGRLVMQMVQHALSLDNKTQRQACAENIIRIMATTNPQLKKSPNYKAKLWEHLAFMADYQLDIDYPVEITKKEERPSVQKLSYPAKKIVLRHYGNLIEQLMERIKAMPSSAQRKNYVKAAGERMKRNLQDWKGDVPDNHRVGADIARYTEGVIDAKEAAELLHNAKNSKNKKGKRQ